MSYTNQTTNLGLPQYIGTDIPSILTDVNGAYSKIDTAYGEQTNKITESTQNSEQAKSLASAAQAQAQAASNEVASVSNRVKTLETSINGIEEVANTATEAANSANTLASVAKTTADTALSKANTAQSTANTALNSANTASINATNANNAVNNMKNGSNGVVAYIPMKTYTVDNATKNVAGGTPTLHFSLNKHGSSTDCVGRVFTTAFIYAASSTETSSVEIIGNTYFPIFTFDGNPLGAYSPALPVGCGTCVITDNSNTIQARKSIVMWYDSSTNKSIFAMSDLTTAINRMNLNSFDIQMTFS